MIKINISERVFPFVKELNEVAYGFLGTLNSKVSMKYPQRLQYFFFHFCF